MIPCDPASRGIRLAGFSLDDGCRGMCGEISQCGRDGRNAATGPGRGQDPRRVSSPTRICMPPAGRNEHHSSRSNVGTGTRPYNQGVAIGNLESLTAVWLAVAGAGDKGGPCLRPGLGLIFASLRQSPTGCHDDPICANPKGTGHIGGPVRLQP